MTVDVSQDMRLGAPPSAEDAPAGLLDTLPGMAFRIAAPDEAPDGDGLRFLWVSNGSRDLVDLPPTVIMEEAGTFFGLVRSLRATLASGEPAHSGDLPDLLRSLIARRRSATLALTVATPGTPEGAPCRMAVRPVALDDGRVVLDGLLTAAEGEEDMRGEVERAEARFQKAFQASPGLFAISDPQTGRHIDVNDRWLQVMGWRREEVIGRTAHDLGVWADPRDRDRLVARLAEFGSIRDFETRFRTRSGIEREFLVAGEMIELDNRPRLLLVAHDVTDRNNAQRALGRLNAELEQRVEQRTSQLREENRRREEIQRRLEAIMDGVADAIVSADGEGRINGFNAAAQAMFGWSVDEAMGMPLAALMPEPYASRHADFVTGYLSSGTGSVIGMGRELPALRRDGSTFPVEVALSHLRLADEDVFIAAIRDITDRREAEEQLRAAKEAAESANTAKSAFLSSMSHELRTPMNAILGFAQLLEVMGGDTLNDTQRDYIRHILSAGQHLLTLINDVLDLSKIESGRVALSLEPVGLDEVIDGTLSLLGPVAEKHGVTVEASDLAGGLPRAWADYTRLGQVLLNLATNAVKYNRPRGTVRLRARPSPRRPDMVEIAVQDTGPGIPADRQGDLFVPFNRLGAESGPIEGTGIGLSIAKQLVEMMGGVIGCDSVVGQGSTFWIDLPLADGEVPPRSAPTSGRLSLDDTARPASHEALNAGPWTILYVEDNPPNLRLVANVLSRFPGVRMLSAPTAEIGLDLAKAHTPDLVVMDLNLPGADGFEALLRLRNRPETRDTPVIAVTARVGPREVHRGLRAGFDAYLTKPLDLGQFLREIDRLLGGVLETRRRG